MSGIVLIAPFFALLVSFGALVAVHVIIRFCRVDGSAKAAGCSVASLMFPIACIFFLWLLPRITTHSGLGASTQVANKHLLTFTIPNTAKNIDYHRSYFSGLTDAADFTMSESDFFRWMSENDRTPIGFEIANKQLKWSDGEDHSGIGPPQITSVPAMLNGNEDDDVQPSRGYYWDDYNPKGNDDSGITVIYDAVKQRVFVRSTTF